MHIYCKRCAFRTTEHCKISWIPNVNVLKYGADLIQTRDSAFDAAYELRQVRFDSACFRRWLLQMRGRKAANDNSLSLTFELTSTA